MRLTRKLLLGITAGLILIGAAIGWVVATESGARWLLARAEPYLPDALTIEGISGSLAGGLSVDSVRWNDAAADVIVERVFVNARILPLLSRRVYVDRLEAGAVTVDVVPGEQSTESRAGLPDFRLPIDLWILESSISSITIGPGDGAIEIDTIDLVARMEGADLEIEFFRLRSRALSLTVAADARFAGAHPVDADVQWRWSDGLAFGGRLRARGNESAYRIEHTLSAPLSIETRGSVSLDEGTPTADLDHEWGDVEWRLGERLIRSSGGTLATVGDPQSVDVTLQAAARLDELPETEISLTGNVNPARLRIDDASFLNELGSLNVDGEVDWTDSPLLGLDFRVGGLDPARLDARLAGVIGAAGRVQVETADSTTDLDLRIDAIEGRINDAPVAGFGSFLRTAGIWSIADMQIRLGDNRVDAAGRLAQTSSIDIDFELDDLQQFLADAKGSLEGSLNLTGSVTVPEVRITASGNGLAWGGFGVGDAVVDSTFRPEGLSFVDLRAADIAAGGRKVETLDVSASGSLERHRLNLFAETDTSDVELSAVGGIADGAWLGEIATVDFGADVVGRWASETPSTLAVSASRIEFSDLCVLSEANGSRVCAGGLFEPGGEAELRFEADSIPVAALPLGLPETTSASGSIDARLGVVLTGGTVNGSGSIGMVDGRLTSLIDDEELTIEFTDARADMSIADNRGEATAHFELEGGGSASLEIQSDDVLDPGAAIDGSATLAISDAELFAFLLPALSNPEGVIDGTLEIGGSLREPEFAGALTLENGRFGVRPAGITIVDVSARVEQRASGRLSLSGSARSGEGSVSIDGETSVSADAGIRSEIRIRGEDFELLKLPDWQLAASPDVAVVFDEQTARVTGSLAVPRASINLREIPQTAVSASSDVVVHRPDGEVRSRGRRIDIDVEASLGDDVNFSGFGLVTGLGGALRVRGGTDAPYTGVGRLVLDGGRYEAYGQELEIERGNLIFNGPLDEPQLDVRAVRRAGDVTAGILLTGTPSQLRSELVSEPPLSEAETLSYLLTGRSLESATEAGEGDTLNQAAFALGLSGAGSIVSQIRSDLGLDTLSVEGGASDSRIVAGKRFGERLFVEYGYGLIDQLGTLLLRYQLNDRLVLESRTGAVSNLDLVYSVKKR